MHKKGSLNEKKKKTQDVLSTFKSTLLLTVILFNFSPFLLFQTVMSIHWFKKGCWSKAMITPGICYKPPS